MVLSQLLQSLNCRRVSSDTLDLARRSGDDVYAFLRERLRDRDLNSVQTARALYLLEFIASDSYLDRQSEVLEISSSYVEHMAKQVRTQAALNLAKISILWEGISANREHWMTQVLGGLAGKADKEIVKPLVGRAKHLGIEQRHQAYIDWFLAH